MKKNLRLWVVLGLLLAPGLASGVWAQCTSTTTLAFSGQPGGDNWKARTPIAVPAGTTLTTVGTTGYSSGATGTNAVLDIQTLNGSNRTLYWYNAYAGTTTASERSSTVTFTFNHAVTNPTIQLQDVDAATGFTDEVTFTGSNNGVPVTPTLTRPAGSSVVISGSVATGFGNVTTNPGGTVTASYTGSVTSITLVYKNVAGGTPGGQAVGIDQLTWCRSTPVAADVVNAATLASTAGQTDIDGLQAAAEGTIDSYTITQLPPANQGVLYYNSGTLFANYVPVTAGQSLSPARAASLRFDPAASFAGGNVVFRYSATDNASLTSAPATFTIPIQAVAAPVGCAPSYLDGNTYSGLTAEYYNGYFNDVLTFFDGRTPNLRRIDAQVDFPTTSSFGNLVAAGAASGTAADPNAFSARYRGSIYIPTTGNYTFYLNSDDASYLWLDAAAIAATPTAASATINHGGLHTESEKASATVTLSAGLHHVLLMYGDNSVDNILTFSYAGPGISKRVVPGTVLCAGPGNLPPVANNVTSPLTTVGYSLAPLSGTDADGSVVSFLVNQLPANGTLKVNGVAVSTTTRIPAADAGKLTFEPNAGYIGTTTFTYYAIDNADQLSNAAATYTVQVVNRPPVVANDSRDVPLNTAVNGNVALNDYDQEQNVFTVALRTAAAHGTVVLNANGTYTYTPATGYTGPDSFTYTACDNASPSLCSSNATVSLRVFSTSTACTSASGSNLLTNPAFSAGNTGFSTNYRYVASTFVANDFNSGLYPEGTYTVGANANSYHPNFQGTGHGGTNDNYLLVNGASSIRTLYSQTVTVQPNRYYTFSAFFNNLLPPNSNSAVPELGFVINGESVSGTIQLNESPDQWVQFSDVWFSGSNTTATFEIRNVSTVQGGNDLGVDDVYFGSCNVAPTAMADAASIMTGTTATISVLTNDLDPENSFNLASVDLNPGLDGRQTSVTLSSGTFSVDASGVVSFVPVAGFVGTATAPYTVQDAAGAPTNQANIVVTVQPLTADLVVRLTAPADNATVTAGQPVTFTMQVLNNGPAAAGSVAPTVQLPAGLTGPGTNGTLTFSNGGSYNSATGLVSFPITTSQASGTTTAYSVTFLAPATGPFIGSASATAATPDLNTATNGATATVQVAPAFDLTTTLSAPTTVGTGTPLTYTVVTKNAGPSLATGVIQTLSLPGDLTQLFVSNKGTYAYNAGSNTTVVTFPPLEYLPAGHSVTNTVRLAAPATAGSFAATATVVGSGETVLGNNSASTSTTVSATSGLAANVHAAVAATSGGLPVTHVAPGAPLLLTAQVSNAGAGTATAVTPRLSLPAGLTPTSLTINAGGAYDAVTGVVSWPATSLTSGAAQSYTVQLPTPAYGPLRASVSASTLTADPVPADNGATTLVTISPAADVLTTIVGPATVTAGQRVTYTVTTVNNGAVAASNVQQFVRLPPAVANLTYTSNVLAGTTGSPDVQPNQTLLAYPTIPSLAPGQILTNTISFDAPATASFPVMGFVTSTTPDLQTANNTNAVLVTGSRAADVVATIAGPEVVVNGTPVVLSVRTLNNGLSPAASVTTTVQLPVGLSNVVARDAAGNIVASAYNATTGLVTWPAQAEVAVGAAGAVTNTITFNAPDVAAVTATAVASVTGSTNDLSRTNNAATFTTSILRATATAEDLGTAISASTSTQTAGQTVTFTVTTTNYSSAAATNVVQRVALPVGLSAASFSISNDGVYDPATGIVTFPAVASLASGVANQQNNTITVIVPGVGPLTAVASVSSVNSDGAPGNNVASTSVAITSLTNVRAIVRGPSPTTSVLTGSVLPGQPVTYLVRALNDGPSPAQGVTMTVQIPTNLDPSKVVISGGGTYAPGSGLVTFPAIGTLLAGQEASAAAAYTITFPAPAGSPSFWVTGTATTSTAQVTTSDDSQTYTTNLANQVVVANALVNSLTAPDGNTATTAQAISPLSATDADGSVTSFVLTSLPNTTTEGTLFYAADGVNYAPVTLTNGRFPLAASTAGNLRFDPVTSFVGNAFFTYAAIDNSGAESAAVLYTLPVGLDNAAVYTAGPVLGGTVAYQNGDVITSGFDANGGKYSFSATTNLTTVADVGIRLATTDAAGTQQLNTLGLALNAATGQITVSNRQLLRSGTYSITITTTDEFGGTNTQAVPFTIGGAPLPVELVAFTAETAKVNAVLTWKTAAEKNNDFFLVERSLNGSVFEAIGKVQGHGTSTQGYTYSFTDAGIGAKVSGTVYYRLRQVDRDGTADYSPVRTVRFQGNIVASLSVYPNPVKAQDRTTTLDLTTLPQGAYQATVLDVTGRVVARYSVLGGSALAMPVAELQAGTYLVLVRGNGQQFSQRLIKE
ncbi:Ig-like domain-containing protein [Hymenobacter chitinivorans]|uniref:Putative repeat protein (TIGR01451 family)/predicted secreted protein (Por secretion system target) n=1 Tax=Hymenobacter chitinivorans DSM 11115 TaxID=1121954 RepID=A0A2M9BS14_9BACT|nr:Ig-like domain-containing protein [Hymenobacter chitinivorans]PJJ60728.1 putative repeat protein (TIGR01451 family)/predicted secreted protein (Por secretion system target) [Hymenobacter chitinivorans DSM 11115]